MSAVAITGWAWRTPLGHDVPAVVDRLLAGDTGVQQAPRFLGEGYGCQLGAVVDEEPARSKHRRVLRRIGLLAQQAAVEAIEHASASRGARLGVHCAYGGLRPHIDEVMGPLRAQLPSGERSWERGFEQLHPFWMLWHLSNNAHAVTSMELDARGDGVTYGGANASATAIAGARRALLSGAVDAVVVIAYDTLVQPEKLLALAARGTASAATLASLVGPYDPAAAGFVPGEAAAAVVLERAVDATDRALAYVDARDAADGSQGLPSPAVWRRLCSFGRADDVIDGAALADRHHDDAERAAAAAAVGADAPLTAVQAQLGHLGAASGVVQSIALAALLRRGRLPAIRGLRSPTPGALRPLVTAEDTHARAALCLHAGAPGLAGALRVSLDPA
jgi:3-oxoacyl-(acyl-carrier-protein) synthase